MDTYFCPPSTHGISNSVKGPENFLTKYSPSRKVNSKQLSNVTYMSSFGCRPKLVRRHIPESGLWACDYCQVATFRTYEEAYNHEQTCTLNHNNMANMIPQYSENTFCPCVMRLSMPGDKDSLSDRQCYVRSHFFDIFTATSFDVATRHSKGAQKLYIGQIGLRCMHCSHLASKDRTERAICYPSSISRIYQTIADMQRFHFESCSAIPEDMKQTYKSLKTTRPRGVGSPQEYWIMSARKLGLVDTPHGIRLASCVKRFQINLVNQMSSPPLSQINGRTQNITRHDSNLSKKCHGSLPLKPVNSESIIKSTLNQYMGPKKPISKDEMHYRNSDEANMLLALRYTCTRNSL